MFDNFISLGPWCPTASAMSKYGLRSWSGPFDWLVTPDFKNIMYFLEHDFKDFLLKENLENLPKDSTGFRDKRFEITFLHDKEYAVSLGKNYDKILRKYNKKIERFRKEIKRKSCFLRSVVSEKDLKYILSHNEYIHETIKRTNKENEIIFLLSHELHVCTEQLKGIHYYMMPGKYSADTYRLLRGWFDGADDFLTFCGLNFNAEALLQNIAYDRKKEEQMMEDKDKVYSVTSARYSLLLKCTNYDFNSFTIENEIIIYGAGNIGRYFYYKIKNRCNVKYFVDLAGKGKGDCVDGVPVIWLDTLVNVDLECTSFIVTATYDYENICESIREYFPDASILSLEQLIN